jgi:iron complex transport system ATP-binding protein
MAELTIRGLSVARAGKPVLRGVDLALGKGACVALLGPNGAGKTTLLRAALGLERPLAGQVRLGGADPSAMDPAHRARIAAYLPQARPLAWPLSVRDLVGLGRFAHGGAIGRLAAADAAAAARALAACGLELLADRRADALSGGELARAHVARALAAEAPLLFADEPTAALDPAHAWRVMALIADFVAQGGAALVALHDVNLAAAFASRCVLLKDGAILADGPPETALTEDTLGALYGVQARVRREEGRLAIDLGGPR